MNNSVDTETNSVNLRSRQALNELRPCNELDVNLVVDRCHIIAHNGKFTKT